MKSHQYIAAGFFAVDASFSSLAAYAQTTPQPSPSESTEAWTVTKYISTDQQQHEAASHYLITCLNNILKDLDSHMNPDGTPRTEQQIKNNYKLGKYINRLFPLNNPTVATTHYQELAGFLEQRDKNGKGEDTVETAIYTYLSDTLEEAKKPR